MNNLFFITFGDVNDNIIQNIDNITKNNPQYNVRHIIYSLDEIKKITQQTQLNYNIKYHDDYLLNWVFNTYKLYNINDLYREFKFVIANNYGGIILDPDINLNIGLSELPKNCKTIDNIYINTDKGNLSNIKDIDIKISEIYSQLEYIPKTLWFVWIGDNKPNYVDFAVNAFKQVNPDFKANLIYDNISNPKNDIVKELSYIYDHYDDPSIFGYKYYNIFKRELQSYTGNHFKNNKKIITICNVLRVVLIYEYGGIYCDCDMFPVKPFDDWILQKPFQTYFDNCWFGGRRGCAIYNNNTQYQHSDIGKYLRTNYSDFAYKNIKYSKNTNFLSNKYLFENCKLEYGQKVLDDYDGMDYYIDHYFCGEHVKRKQTI